MSELVDYSDSDKSESDISLNEYETSINLSNPAHFQSSQSVHIAEEDFFNLKDMNDESNTNFWTSTIHDNDLLPCIVPMINKDDKAFSLQKDKHLEEQNLSHTIDSTTSWNHTEILNGNSNFLISYVIDYKASNIVDTNDSVIYPRLSLQWPYLALCGPLCKQPNETIDKLSSHILIWRLPYPDSEKNSPSLICDYKIHLDHKLTSTSPSSSSFLSPYSRRDSYCWTKFHSSTTDSQCLQLIAATHKGLIEMWDINQGKKIREFNVFSQTGQLLRCASLPVENFSSFLLTGGISGIISLWDLRISASKVPQLKYSHTELKASIADLLWLNENQFSSCSDTVDRNNCEHNIAVWDIRFTKPISHQLYQIQAHPLGIAYNPSGNLLASGSWSSSGPVIWSTVHKIDSSSILMTPMKKLPGFRSSPKSMVTDVAWIPNQYVSNGRDSIIAVQSNGTIIVYSSI
ncbi:unnamed protein product [Schistosoma intercalatum]|nr:unnamed protein product [Schistosoma intercalatum]CAH8606853.1 unnamed protein product [Schistosoma intercalatum]